MISQHQFNEVLKEINAAFEEVNKRIDKLEKGIAHTNKEEVKDGNTKKGKSKG